MFLYSLKLSFYKQYIVNSLNSLFSMKVGMVSIQFSDSALSLLYELFNTIFELIITKSLCLWKNVSEEICGSRIDTVPIYALSGRYNLFQPDRSSSLIAEAMKSR